MFTVNRARFTQRDYLIVGATANQTCTTATRHRVSYALQKQLHLLESGEEETISEASDRVYSSQGDRSGIG